MLILVICVINTHYIHFYFVFIIRIPPIRRISTIEDRGLIEDRETIED